MIDTSSEVMLSLNQAARCVPSRSGCGVNVSTVWRWATRGVKGHRLETVVCGGWRYTSEEALARFFAATTAAAEGTPVPRRTPAARQRAIEAAERELERGGA